VSLRGSPVLLNHQGKGHYGAAGFRRHREER
jgi:hypothetical protein